MDTAQLRLIYVVTDLMIPLAVGYWLRQRSLISGERCNQLIRFNIVVVATLLSALSFWVMPLQANLIFLPLFGVILCVIPGGVAYLLTARRYSNMLERGSYLSAAILSNLGTLGGLCAFLLYGELGFAYAQMVGLFQNLVLLMFCFPMAQYYYQKHCNNVTKRKVRMDWRGLFLSWNQLPVVGMIAGMLCYANGIPRPAALGMVFEALVHVGAWLALVPVGYLIDLRAATHYYRRILDLLPIKYVITPALTYALAGCLFDDHIILGTLLVLGSTPTAINAVITARLFNLDVDLSVAAFIMTTAVFLVLVFPVLFFYLV